MTAGMKAVRSRGFLEVTRAPSTTAGASIHSAPALIMSSLMAGTEVSRRPLATPAETSTEPPWQIAATRPPLSATAATNRLDGFGAPEVVGCPSAGDDDSIEIGRVEVVDDCVGIRGITVLGRVRVVAHTRDNDCDAGLL